MESRVDGAGSAALRELVDALSRLLATAVGDAVAVRRLDSNGGLVPLAAHHPDSGRTASMRAVMARTEDSSEGLWAPVVRRGETVRWSAQRTPTAPSSRQTAFIDAWSVQAVVGMPVVSGERVIGGAALVRFGVARDFSADDEDMLSLLASRLGPVLELLDAYDPA
nr:GAF domain-containing protein [Nocardioides flavescens]